MNSAISLQNIKHQYRDRQALCGVSLEIAPGQIVGLVGPNGSGKTTLLKLLSTLLPLQSGTASIGGCDLRSNPDGVRRLIGVTFQNPSLDIKLTVHENLLHQGHLYGLQGGTLNAAIDRVLTNLQFSDRARSLVETLSGGLKRRVEIAKCLLHAPQILLLDEPSTGLDPRARDDFWQILMNIRSRTGVTIVMTSHILSELKSCDRIIMLEQGRIITDGPVPEAAVDNADTTQMATIPRIISSPTVIQAAGNKPKRIEEFVGRVNTGDDQLSVARMISPGGWQEPGQKPEFREVTVVLRGTLQVEYSEGKLTVHTGQAVITQPGQWVRYSTPEPEGAEYIAICLPAFSPNTVHRDEC